MTVGEWANVALMELRVCFRMWYVFADSSKRRARDQEHLLRLFKRARNRKKCHRILRVWKQMVGPRQRAAEGRASGLPFDDRHAGDARTASDLVHAVIFSPRPPPPPPSVYSRVKHPVRHRRGTRSSMVQGSDPVPFASPPARGG